MDGNDKELKVVHMREQRQKKEKGEKSKQRLSRPLVYEAIARTIASQAPNFSIKVWPVKVDDGQRMVIKEVKDNVVKISNRDEVAESIIKYIADLPQEYALTWEECRYAANFWLYSSPLVDMPPHFRWADDSRMTFNRLPWKEGVTGPTPTWDGLLGRLSNATALKAWIGALFVNDATHQQYIWMYGQGGEGKGCIDRFLEKVIGTGYRSEEPPESGDKFWTYGLIGATLVTFADCNNRTFPSTGKFKSLVANDAVRCEEKNGKIFSTRLGCRYMFFSNEQPNLTTERADMRRVIYCEFAPQSEQRVDPDFERRLWEEGGPFITSCIQTYHNLCPKHGPIPAEMDDVLDLAAANESHFSTVFERCFVVKSSHPDAANHVKPHVKTNRMTEIINTWFKDRRDRDGFKAYLKRNYGAFSQTVKLEGNKAERRYLGIEVHPSLPTPKDIEARSRPSIDEMDYISQ